MDILIGGIVTICVAGLWMLLVWSVLKLFERNR